MNLIGSVTATIQGRLRMKGVLLDVVAVVATGVVSFCGNSRLHHCSLLSLLGCVQCNKQVFWKPIQRGEESHINTMSFLTLWAQLGPDILGHK
jgi:hypothetical protein